MTNSDDLFSNLDSANGEQSASKDKQIAADTSPNPAVTASPAVTPSPKKEAKAPKVESKNVNADSIKFAADLLEEQGVAIVPGLAFGTEGYFRFSFATDEATIREGISRIKRFVEGN